MQKATHLQTQIYMGGLVMLWHKENFVCIWEGLT